MDWNTFTQKAKMFGRHLLDIPTNLRAPWDDQRRLIALLGAVVCGLGLAIIGLTKAHMNVGTWLIVVCFLLAGGYTLYKAAQNEEPAWMRWMFW